MDTPKNLAIFMLCALDLAAIQYGCEALVKPDLKLESALRVWKVANKLTLNWNDLTYELNLTKLFR